MKLLKRLGVFLHVIDDSGNLDLIDLSFIATMLKIILAPGIDFQSVCTLVPVIIAKMHITHLRSKSDNQENR